MKETIYAALTCACLTLNSAFDAKPAVASPLPQTTVQDSLPFFQQVDRITLTIAPQTPKQAPASSDPADVYVPRTSDLTKKFPIVLLLQGGLVDKSAYSNFATEVARSGFIVVVPNHTRSLTAPNGQTITGLAAEQQQVNDVLKQMIAENANPQSRLANRVDTSKLGLLGHW